jgi:hypothetical protein
MKYRISENLEVEEYDPKKHFMSKILIIVFAPFLYSFIHEIGHGIIALVFGWDILTIKLSYFPFIFDLKAHIVIITHNAIDWQIILMKSFGSIFCLIIGSVFLFLFYKFRLNHYAEFFLFIYFIVFSLDLIIYIIWDVFWVRYGDWYDIYQLSPEFVGSFLIFSILYLILLTFYHKKILNRLEIRD